MTNINIKIIGFVFFSLVFFCCNNENKLQVVKIKGLAQGTYYSIIYYEKDGTNYQTQIDSLLNDFNKTASVYDSTSIISKINRNISVGINDQFTEIFNLSVEVSNKTDGNFDVSVGPLVNAWGFGFKNKNVIENDSSLIDSLLNYVDYKMIKIINNKIIKEKEEISIDFNSIAQGYSVDLVSDFLEKKGIANYLIDIGGEVYGKGNKPSGDLWKVGIEEPNISETRNIDTIVELSNMAIATSGNYRKFYIENGIKYSHTINPKTGYPVKHSLLSATVLAKDCATADAYATAFMVMGLEEAIKFLNNNKWLEAYLIYEDKNNNYKIYKTRKFK